MILARLVSSIEEGLLSTVSKVEEGLLSTVSKVEVPKHVFAQLPVSMLALRS